VKKRPSQNNPDIYVGVIVMKQDDLFAELDYLLDQVYWEDQVRLLNAYIVRLVGREIESAVDGVQPEPVFRWEDK
jgi:hypothetical protein